MTTWMRAGFKVSEIVLKIEVKIRSKTEKVPTKNLHKTDCSGWSEFLTHFHESSQVKIVFRGNSESKQQLGCSENGIKMLENSSEKSQNRRFLKYTTPWKRGRGEVFTCRPVRGIWRILRTLEGDFWSEMKFEIQNSGEGIRRIPL